MATTLKHLLFTILMAMAGCTSDRPQRLIMISMRGISALDVKTLTRHGVLRPDGGFGAMVANGFAADRLEPIYNPETAPEMATFETGAWPSRHGIVGNTFYQRDWPTSGLQYGYVTPLECETLWEAAARQGKRVLRIGSLFADTLSRVFSLPQGESLGEARWPVLKRIRTGAQRTNTFEHVLHLDSLRITVETDSVWDRSFAASLIDTVRDGRESYSALILNDGRQQVRLAASQWAAVELTSGNPRVGVWIKLLSVQDTSVQLYVRPPFRNRGSPSEFVEQIERTFGFCPGYPDIAAYVSGRIDATTLKEEILRETNYGWQAAGSFLGENDFDLMMIDYSLMDRYGHAFYNADLSDSTNPWVEAYRHADRHLMELIDDLPSRTGLMVSSGYGFYPSSRQIAFGGKEFSFLLPVDSLSMAVSTVSAHVYLQSNGVSVDQLVEFFNALTDPLDSKAIVAEVRRPYELDSLGLLHPHRSGDLWIRLNPGYTFRSDWKSAVSIGPSRFVGEHGYKGEGSRGIFYYLGPPIPKPLSRVVNAVDVAVTAASLLEIHPPRGSQGKPIF